MVPPSCFLRLLALIFLLCATPSTARAWNGMPAKPFIPPPPMKMPPTDLKDTDPHLHVDKSKIIKGFSKLDYLLFSLNRQDTSHVVAGFGHADTCTIGLMFQIRGLPRAIRGEDLGMRYPGIASWTTQEVERQKEWTKKWDAARETLKEHPDTRANQKGGGKGWRGVRVWYGSAQVPVSMWGAGEESLRKRMEGLRRVQDALG